MKAKAALIENIALQITGPNVKAVKLLQSSKNETIGKFLLGPLPGYEDEIGFSLVTNNGIVISFALKKETALSLAKVLANAVLDGQVIQ